MRQSMFTRRQEKGEAVQQSHFEWSPRIGPLMAKQLVLLALASTIFILPGPSPASALQIKKLKGPQSFLHDPNTQGYFISNVNGEPTAKDNNGFITKLDSHGKVVNLQFIRGGTGKTVLHAPKGMAIADNVLYVADLDTLRGFDTETGRPVVTVAMPNPMGDSPRSQSLADIVHDGQGILYASAPNTNTIYRIDISREHTVSLLIRDEALAGPRGLALHPKTGRLIVVSWDKGKILEVDRKGAITVLVSNSFFTSRFQHLEGVDFDRWGNMYVSDFTAGKIWRMRPDQRFHVIAEHLTTPADISVDRANHLILVPYLYGNAAEMNGLESPIKSKKKKRTLADYGFGFPRPPKEEQPPNE